MAMPGFPRRPSGNRIHVNPKFAQLRPELFAANKQTPLATASPSSSSPVNLSQEKIDELNRQREKIKEIQRLRKLAKAKQETSEKVGKHSSVLKSGIFH